MSIKGKFIVFEGIDGSGTTTISKFIAQKFKNSVWTFEPSDNAIGKFIRSILQYKEETFCNEAILSLFVADRAQHTQNLILPALNTGKHVFCDRYTPSTIVYQTIPGYLCNKMAIKNIENNISDSHGCIIPDVVFLLDCDLDVARTRRKTRNRPEELYETDSYQKCVAKQYKYWSDITEKFNVIKINANNDKNNVVSQIMYYLNHTYSLG
jgi:dTMP kinase